MRPASQAPNRNALDDELRRIERYGLIVVDEIGYLPLERQAANLLIAALKGKSYRRRQRGTGPAPAVQAPPLRGSA